MSQRPIRVKQANRMRKALRKELPRRINLIHFLKDRGYADTTGQAKKIILDGRVKSESHVLGIFHDPGLDKDFVSPLVSADLRKTIVVHD